MTRKSRRGAADIQTVSVPYLPPIGEDILPPEYFEKTIRSFGKDMPDITDFELDEIQGTRLVKLDDEWVELGHIAIYRRKESHDTQE